MPGRRKSSPGIFPVFKAESKPGVSGFDSERSCNGMDEKRQLPLWAAVAGKDMEFAAT